MNLSFDSFKTRRDQELFFESAGFQRNDVNAVTEAMQQWVAATEQLVEALEKIPSAQGALFDGQNEDHLEQEVALEVQRARHVVEEGNLVDIASRINQYAARLTHGASQLVD